MAASNFDAALARVLAHEGGYSNHPDDPGGATKFGVTLAVYRQHAKPGASAADVRAMALSEAKAIYRKLYWDAQRCDELPAGIDYALFDYGVNSGTGRSGKVLRRLVGISDAASVVSDVVIAAVKSKDARRLIEAMCDERLRFLQSLKTWPVFGKGWGRRVAEVRRAALAMAGGPVVLSDAVTPASGRGEVPINRKAQAGTAAVIVATGGSAAQQAQQDGLSLPWIAAILISTAMMAVAVWWLWRWRQKHLQER